MNVLCGCNRDPYTVPLGEPCTHPLGQVLSLADALREVARISADVANRHGLSVEQLREPFDSHALHDTTVEAARAEAMRLARDRTGLSYPEIGRAFNRHHSTVMYACRDLIVVAA